MIMNRVPHPVLASIEEDEYQFTHHKVIPEK